MPNTNEIRLQDHSFMSPIDIVVATDLSDAGYLLPHIVAQAKASGARVTLVHTLFPANVIFASSGVPSAPEQARIDHDALLALRGVAEQIEAQGIQCNTVVKHGFPVDIIQQEILRQKASRLILGTHGRNKLGQFVLGSVARELIREVDIPVFVVGPGGKEATAYTTPRTILHPVSLTGNYEESARLALDIARRYQAELILLHVLDKEVRDEVNAKRTFVWANNALKALVPDDESLASVHTLTVVGDTVKEILTVAEETNADWMVLGVDGEIRFWTSVDNTAYRLFAASPCPVLTLRHSSHKQEAHIPSKEHRNYPVALG